MTRKDSALQGLEDMVHDPLQQTFPVTEQSVESRQVGDDHA